MPRNRAKFAQDITSLIQQASAKAYMESFNVPSSSSDTVETLMTKMTNKFSTKFSQELGPELASLIDKQLDDQLFNVSGLTAAGSTVTGIMFSV